MEHNKLEIINESGEKLVCIEAKMTGVDNLPVVILAHGFAYFKEEDGIFTEVANRLAAKGFAVYYFDFSGCGESEGDYSKTTLTKLVGDLKSVYKTVTALPYVDASNISLMSHSYGSNVILAAQLPNIKRMVLSGSFTDASKIIKDIFPDYNEHGISTRAASGERTVTVGPQFWKDIKGYDMTALIKYFDCPVLFIHGKQDDIVPIQYMYPLVSAAQHAVGPVVLENSNHDLKPEREIAFKAVVEFFTN